MTNIESPQRPLQQIATLHVDEILFDMDGTLIDSIAVVEAAWRTLAQEEGVNTPSGAPISRSNRGGSGQLPR